MQLINVSKKVGLRLVETARSTPLNCPFSFPTLGYNISLGKADKETIMLCKSLKRLGELIPIKVNSLALTLTSTSCRMLCEMTKFQVWNHINLSHAEKWTVHTSSIKRIRIVYPARASSRIQAWLDHVTRTKGVQHDQSVQGTPIYNEKEAFYASFVTERHWSEKAITKTLCSHI